MNIIPQTEKHYLCHKCGSAFFAKDESGVIIYYGIIDKDNNIIFKPMEKVSKDNINMICARCGLEVNPDIINDIE